MAIAIASPSRVAFVRSVFALLILMLCIANATAFSVT